MKYKFSIITIFNALICGNALAADLHTFITQKTNTHQIVSWVSSNTSDDLSIEALGTYFTVHLSVAPGSLSSIRFTCAFNPMVIVTPGSNVVCFVDNGNTVTWSSSSSAAASGTYEILTQP